MGLLQQKRLMRRSALMPKDVKAARVAYADAQAFEPTLVDYAKRKLMWKPTKCYSAGEFRFLVRSAVRHPYNEFEADRVGRIIAREAPSSCVQLGREYSPAVYVRGPAHELQRLRAQQAKLRAQEADFLDPQTLRLWWD